MKSSGILDELEAIGAQLARGQDLAPTELHRLIRLRSECIAKLAQCGQDSVDPARLAAVFHQGAEAQRRIGVYRDSLQRQLDQVERERRLVGDLKQSLPDARTSLDLEA